MREKPSHTQLQREWNALIERWAADPLAFVCEALFQLPVEQWEPWEPGTPRPKGGNRGPEKWQGAVLRDMGHAKIHGKRRFSIRSGHGVGKSTLLAWAMLWFLCFFRPLKMPFTANTADQLEDVLWSELKIWQNRLPGPLRDKIEILTTRAYIKGSEKEVFAVARTARPEKPEALAGFHSENLVLGIDEASGVDEAIFETASGALSDEHSWQFMAGNPTRTSGYFFDSHHKSRSLYRTYHVPCAHSSRVSPNYAVEMAHKYGEDSNIYKVRVLGDFPTSEDDAVINLNLVLAALERVVAPADRTCVWGVDVARFGDDSSALAKRRANVLLEPVIEWRKKDTMQIAGLVKREYDCTPHENQPTAINIDVIGLGAGVVDRLREQGLPARGINVAESPATDSDKYMRLRDELWWRGREWFESRDCTIPADDELIAELTQPKYTVLSTGKLQVESKADLKKRGIPSPNRADAFLLTLAGGDRPTQIMAQPVSRHAYDPFAVGTDSYERYGSRPAQAGTDWSPF